MKTLQTHQALAACDTDRPCTLNTTQSLDRALAVLASLCAVVVGLMVVGIVFTKSSQDFYQSARSVQAFAEHLSTAPMVAEGLRINLGLDNLFMVLYAAFFVLLAARLRALVGGRIVTVALSAMLMTVFLDALENHHITMMLHSLENGLPISVGDGQFQMVASQIKFHASYFSIVLFGLGFWRLGKLGRLTALSLWCYVPLGVLISVTPVESAKALVLGRTVFFVFAFVLSACLFARSARRGSAAADAPQ